MTDPIYEYLQGPDPQRGYIYKLLKITPEVPDSSPKRVETLFDTHDPCHVADYLNSQSENNQELAAREEIKGLMYRLYYDCFKRSNQSHQQPIPKKSEPASPASVVDAPPDFPDTPEQMDAPAVEIDSELLIVTTTSPLSGPTGADLVYDQQKPAKPDKIQDYLRSSGYAEDKIAELLERALHNEPFPMAPHPTHSGEVARQPIPGGDPVDLFSGRLTITKVDMDVPTAVLPLQLIRTYFSGRPYYGPWGFGWDHNYNVYLRELDNGDVAHWTGALRENLFHWTGDVFEPQRGVHDRLAHESGLSQAYALTGPGGLTFRFERPPQWSDAERIPLTEIRDRHGNRQSLSYDNHNRIERVEDDNGRYLAFYYSSHGFLETVKDQGGREICYEVDAEYEHLQRVTSPPTATYPEGASTCYAYDDRASHPAMRHNLLRIIDADGMTYLQNDYGGPETGWNFNRVVRQLYGDYTYEIDYTQIQYVPDNSLYVNYPALRVTVLNGSLYTYTFNYRGDLLDYRFRLNRDGSCRVVASQWEYDAQGNMTAEIRPDGGKTAFAYDADNPDPCARGNLLKVELFAPPEFVATSRVVFEAVYDPVYQLPREVLDETGARTRLVYDFDTAPGPLATGRLVRLELPDATLPDGSPQQSTWHVESNSRNQTTATISPEGVRDEIHYTAAGSGKGLIRQLVQDAGVIGHTVEHEYDAFGYLRRTITPGNIVTETIRNALGQIEEVVLPAVNGQPASVRNRYTDDGRLLRSETPRGDYEDGVITENYLANEYVRDVLGYVIQSRIGANTGRPRESYFTTDHDGRVVKAIDPNGMENVRRHDERGLLLSVTVAAGTSDELTTKYVYDRSGRMVRVTDPGGRVTRITHDPWGRISRVHLPNGSEEIYTWGVADRLLGMRVEGDPGDGSAPRVLSRKKYDYDERGRRVRETVSSFRDAPGAATELSTEYFHDGDGRIRRIRLPRGGEIVFKYDGLDRPVQIEDVHGNLEQRTYDGEGNLEQVTRQEVEPDGIRTAIWQHTYDARARLRRTTFPGGAFVEFDYDDRDLLVEQREPLDVAIRFRYGLLGEVEETFLDPGGLGIRQQYEYDFLGRLVRFTDPTGEITQWTRDVLGRPIKTIMPDGGVWTRHYGPSGKLVEETTPSGSMFSFAYQAESGRLAKMSCAPGAGVVAVPVHEHAYDGLDRLVRAAIPGHEVERRFDSLGRLVEERSQGKTLQMKYDDINGYIDLHYPDGRRERTETDLGGRATRISTLTPGALPDMSGPFLAQFAYGGLNRLHHIRYWSGVETSLAYDEGLRLIRIEHALDGQPMASCRYRYDSRNRRRLTQLLDPSPVNRYHDFDNRDRLVEERWGFPLPPLQDAMAQPQHDIDIAAAGAAAANAPEQISYELDAADSRLQKTRSGTSAGTTNYTYAPGHQAISAGPESISYHADGPRIADGARLYDLDALGRVVRVRDAATSAVLAEFTYDALSRVVQGQTGGESFTRWFSGDRWIHADDGGSAVLQQQSFHPSWPLPLAQRSPAGVAVPHPDGTGTAACVTGVDGSVTERLRFDPFGMPTLLEPDGTSVLPPGQASIDPIFGGIPYLENLKLYQTPQRLYDPAHGLFAARDPLLYAGGPSPYLYARHNPVDFVDANGFIPQYAGVGGAPPAPEEEAGSVLYSSEGRVGQYAPQSFELPSAEALGGVNIALGTVGMVIAVGIITGGGGWVVLLGGALLFSGSAVQTGVGLVQTGAGVANVMSPEQAQKMNRGLRHTQSVASVPGLPTYTAVLMFTGDVESASFWADVTDVVSGVGEGAWRMHRFRKAYKKRGGETYDWKTDRRRLVQALRIAYGQPPEGLGAFYNPHFVSAAGRNCPEWMEMAHAIPARSTLLPNWLKNSPLNVSPQMGSTHAMSDPDRFQSVFRLFKEQYPMLHQSWYKWKSGQFSTYWNIVPPLRSVPPWAGRTGMGLVRVFPELGKK